MTKHHEIRFAKQIKAYPIGEIGQKHITEAKCAIVGLGALGSTVAEQLVRAGIGSIRIIDRDFVEISNLHRQSLYSEQDVEQLLPKAVAAQNRLLSIHSSVVIDAIIADLQPSNIEALLDGFDIIVDCSDNFTVRYLINDYCTLHNKIWIYGAVVGTSGTTTTIIPGETPCFRCLFESPPPAGTVDTCDTAGVIAPIVNMIASAQVTEVLKLITKQHHAVNRQLLQIDCWSGQYFKVNIDHMKKNDCLCCSVHQFDWLHALPVITTELCGRDTIQINLPQAQTYSLPNLQRVFSDQYNVIHNKYLLKIQYNELISVIFFPDQRIMIQGTADEQYAMLIINKLLQN